MRSGDSVVALLKGVNVGGNKTFRPKILAEELRKYDIVNLGAAGTFVVRKPGPIEKFRAELIRKLPFEAEVIICNGRDLVEAARGNPFAAETAGPDVVHFMSVLSKPQRQLPALPVILPPDGEWILRIIASRGRFVFGAYRRHMKAIAYLGQIEKILGATATTRNWNTVTAILRCLNTANTG